MRTMEKQTNFIELLKAFWQPDELEVSENEIEKTNMLTSEEKQLLESSTRIKTLEREIQTHEIEKRPKKKNENIRTNIQKDKSKALKVEIDKTRKEKEEEKEI